MPVCKGPDCTKYVGVDRRSGKTYETCFDCRCGTRGCPDAKKSKTDSFCEKCSKVPFCKSDGCPQRADEPSEWCHRCNDQWNTYMRKKCKNVECRSYIPKTFNGAYCIRCRNA
jgi:hypothetical protein